MAVTLRPGPTGSVVKTAISELPHKVVEGDTLAEIAAKRGVSLYLLQQANPGVDPLALQIGSELKMPRKLVLKDIPARVAAMPLGELPKWMTQDEFNDIVMNLPPSGGSRDDVQYRAMQIAAQIALHRSKGLTDEGLLEETPSEVTTGP